MNTNNILKKTICLNMIVKDESHIIKQTLENICSYINLDYWVISDTGSSDNTKEIIIDFFKEKNIKGELVEHEWRDFAYNRNKALDCAYNKSDYIFLFDADDKICGNLILPDKLLLDRYDMSFGPTFIYNRPFLINNRKKWIWKGVLHECLSCLEPLNGSLLIEGDYYIQPGHDGSRNKNPDKYLDDAKLLEKAFEEEQEMGLKSRYAFYCAQSYMTANMLEKSIEWYKKVLTLQNWEQEKYYACYKIGNMYETLNKMDEAILYWSKSYEYDTERLECVSNMVKYYQSKNNHLHVNALYHKFKNNKKLQQKNTKLFSDTTKNFDIEMYNSISSFYINDKKSGYESCKILLINNIKVEYILINIQYYLDYLYKDNDTKEFFEKINNYVNNNNYSNESKKKLADLWKILYDKM